MKHALVLSGGAAHGAWQLGYAERLGRLYGGAFDPDIYVGTSVGGLMAAALAQFGNFRAGIHWYGDLWDQYVHDSRSIYRTWWPRWLGPLACLPAAWKGSLYSARPLRQLIEDNIDVDLIHQSGKALFLTTVDLKTGDLQHHSGMDMQSWEVVYATAAYPIAFEPIRLPHYSLATDGGLREVTPLARAIRSGADRIDVIFPRSNHPSTWTDQGGFLGLMRLVRRALRAVDIMLDEVIENDIRHCVSINAAVRNGDDTMHRIIQLNVHRPPDPLLGPGLDFSRETWTANRERGQWDATAWFRRYEG